MFKNKHYLPLEWSSVGQIIKTTVVTIINYDNLNIWKLLKRHPFSGRCDSAGELLHTPYADSNFHGHRPAVCTTQNTL